MKLNGMKKIGLLAAVMLIAFSIAAVAACPPGSNVLTQALTPGVAIVGTTATLAANTTYCIQQDIVLNVGGWAGVKTIVLQANAKLVGGQPGVTLTGWLEDLAITPDYPIISIQGSGTQVRDLRIAHPGGLGTAIADSSISHAIEVQATGSDSVIRDVTLLDVAGAANEGFVIAFIELQGGQNIAVQGVVIWENAAIGTGVTDTGPTPVGILVSGGNNHNLIANRINATDVAFVPMNCNLGNGHSILHNMVINGGATTVNQIRVNTTNTIVDHNVITLNGVAGTGAGAIGIWINNAMIKVTNNTVANPGGVGAAGSLLGVSATAGATNALIEGNGITGCGTNVAVGIGDAILIAGANVIVQNNPTLQVGVAGPLVLTDIACGIRVAGGAAGVKVLNNPNINSATSGILVVAPNTEVRGNTITDSCTGAAITGAGWLGTGGGIVVAAAGSQNAPIDGNTIFAVSQQNTVLPLLVGSGSGIVMIAGSSNQYITNNEVHNAANNGIEVAAAASVGNQIIENKVYHSAGNGFNIQVGASNTLVKGNTFQDNNNSGIFVTGGALNTYLFDNILVNNGSQGSPPVAPDVSEALVVSGGANNAEVRGNTISTNVSIGENRGIRIEGVRNVIVDRNTIENAATGDSMTHGIIIEGGTSNDIISNNTVEGMAAVGIVIRGGSATLGDVEVQGNTLTDDTLGILFAGGASTVNNKNVINGCCTGFKVEQGVPVTSHVFNGNCVTTNGKYAVQDSMTGTFDATGNFWGDVPPLASKFAGRGLIDYSGALTSCPGTPAPQPGKTHTYGAAAGWYMVSVPLNSGLAADLFGATAYRWNPATGVYDLVTAINAAHGFWVMLPAGKSVTDTGVPVTSDVMLAISDAGWHQISAPWSYPKSAIQVIKGVETKSWADAAAAGWVRDDIYGYKATDANYTTPLTMNPWYGYWVKAEVSGLSLKLLYASGTPVSMAYAPMAFAPTDLPPMPPTFTPSAATLSFGNSPNPVVDVNTTYFEVKGAAAYLVEALKVQIYDLSGRLVYEAEEAGASMAWHTDNIDGEYLANGVYLYKLYALLDGQWVVSTVKNVVILR